MPSRFAKWSKLGRLDQRDQCGPRDGQFCAGAQGDVAAAFNAAQGADRSEASTSDFPVVAEYSTQCH